jgi:peptidoglycan hydrolase-like protein with peptidoglycan-binding domain
VLGAATYHFTQNLSVGARGAEVTALQQFLIDGGYSIPAGATGYFGAQTRAAVIAFQKARGVAQVGNVGPLTRAELNKSVVATSAGSNLSSGQASAIIGFLQSFDADASIIANVKKALGL